MFCCLTFILASTLFAAEHTKDTLDQVKENVKAKKAVIVDVREQPEWDAGHLEGAVLVPLSKLMKEGDSKEFAEKLAKELPKDKIVYTHCKSGRRCLAGADLLKKLGYDTRALKEGFDDLVKAGFPKAKTDKDK